MGLLSSTRALTTAGPDRALGVGDHATAALVWLVRHFLGGLQLTLGSWVPDEGPVPSGPHSRRPGIPPPVPDVPRSAKRKELSALAAVCPWLALIPAWLSLSAVAASTPPIPEVENAATDLSGGDLLLDQGLRAWGSRAMAAIWPTVSGPWPVGWKSVPLATWPPEVVFWLL